MKCKTMERHLENNQATEKLWRHIQGKVDFSFSRKDSLTLETRCLLTRCQPLPALMPWLQAVTPSAQNIGMDLGRLPSFSLGHHDQSLRCTTESLSDVPRIKTGKWNRAEPYCWTCWVSPLFLQVHHPADAWQRQHPKPPNAGHYCLLWGMQSVVSVCLGIG